MDQKMVLFTGENRPYPHFGAKGTQKNRPALRDSRRSKDAKSRPA